MNCYAISLLSTRRSQTYTMNDTAYAAADATRDISCCRAVRQAAHAAVIHARRRHFTTHEPAERRFFILNR